MTLSRPVTTRTYYFPTCSLEVKVAKAPLWGRWLPSLKQQLMQFQLVLDDPCDPQQVPLRVAGGRARLSTLYTQVMTTLVRSADSLEAGLGFVELNFSEGDTAVETLLSERQFLNLAAALEQCAAEVNLDSISEFAEPAIPIRRSPQWRWAAAVAIVVLSIGGVWLARENLPWVLDARSDRDEPATAEEVSEPTPEPLTLPPPRSIELQLKEPTTPTFKAAPMAPPDPVSRPDT